MNNGSTEINTRGTGYLIVRVSTAGGAIPLEGALVSIRGGEKDNSGIIYSVKTDMDGLTEKLPLPTPLKENSEAPNSGNAFSSYNIDVLLEGYYDQFYANVPVFDTITSVQPANMIPISQNKYPDSFAPYYVETFENENPNL